MSVLVPRVQGISTIGQYKYKETRSSALEVITSTKSRLYQES